MEGATDNELREALDRMILLLIARPAEGWEPQFAEITRREIERLAVPAAKRRCDE